LKNETKIKIKTKNKQTKKKIKKHYNKNFYNKKRKKKFFFVNINSLIIYILERNLKEVVIRLIIIYKKF